MLILEAVIVGIAFVVLSIIIHFLFGYFHKEREMEKSSLLLQAFITAALFHIIADYSGLNDFYVSYKK